MLISDDKKQLYLRIHASSSEADQFFAFCSDATFFPKNAVVHLHGLWTSVHEIYALLVLREDLRIIFSEWDPKGFKTLNATLENPQSRGEIRKVWDILKPKLTGPHARFQDSIKRFKHLLIKQTRYVPNAMLRQIPSETRRDEKTQQILQQVEDLSVLSKLLFTDEVPKAHIIFCHAVQLNPYEIAKLHLKRTGTLFYSIHTEDYFTWENTHAAYGLTQHVFDHHPAALLFNHRVSSFWTDQTVYMVNPSS